ncbi:hypothetical protein EDC14_103648 [Hydrogenispora ethanolica]|jgi:hypothetical protein|uniref:Uncharacterized protein n=1 Tax=Hydrogenispora ethanolica TaxID=1082276 RepID=A0A4R1R4A1_HYDET|nr:hypothetical protein [Hydrogenispora ethanolica]TCL60295.1 hypothetical protein EDC14_103648 [Hydrogenispora ethanolica]
MIVGIIVGVFFLAAAGVVVFLAIDDLKHSKAVKEEKQLEKKKEK